MKRTTVIAAVTAVALVAGGTATAFAVTGDDDQERAAGTDAKVTAAQAIGAALKDTAGTAVSAELDDGDGRAVWDVDVLGADGTWHGVRIDPADGRVLGSHTDEADDDGAAPKGASVTAAEAAEAVAGKGTVTSVEPADDGWDQGWQVETRAASSGAGEQDWLVDGSSGKVTADDHDDEESDED